MKNLAIIFAISGIGTWFVGEAQAQAVVTPPVVVVPTAAYPVRPLFGGRRSTYYAPIPVASSATYTVAPAVVAPVVVSTPAYQTTPRFQSEASAADFAPVITNYPSSTATYSSPVVNNGVTTNYAPQTVTTFRVDALAPTVVAPPVAMPFPRTVTYPPVYQSPNIRGYGN
ncbi:MAG: hypothetical protein NXI22_21350 [bacterium]|nr:hypothetical protein [bacterium]